MWDWIAKLAELQQDGTPAAVVTVTSTAGSVPREVGAKMIVLEDSGQPERTDRFFGTIGGGHLEYLILQDARACLREGIPRTIRYPLGAKLGQCCGGVVDVFIEPLNHGPRLYLFGAGHVGRAVARVLSGTAFRVEVIDPREEWIDASNFPPSVLRHPMGWDDFATAARWDPGRTYVAVMTHRHDLDQEIIAWAIEQPARFIGLIGSRTKWARFRQRLAARGVASAKLDRVQCPIGLKTGGKSPQEVAISIAASLLQEHYARASEGPTVAVPQHSASIPAEARDE